MFIIRHKESIGLKVGVMLLDGHFTARRNIRMLGRKQCLARV